MANIYYTPTGKPIALSRGLSAEMRNEFNLIRTGFDGVATAFNGKANVNGQVWTGTHDFTGANLIAPLKADKAGSVYTGTHDYRTAAAVLVPTPPALVNSKQAANMETVLGIAFNTFQIPILQSETLTVEGQTLGVMKSYRSEYINTPAGSLFYLPDARQFAIGFAYEIYTVNAVVFMRADGVFVGSAAAQPGLSRLWLIDNTTLGGTWLITPAVPFSLLAPAIYPSQNYTITTSLSQANSQTRVITLDATRSLALYSTAGAAAASSGLYAVMLTSAYASGRPTISVGAPIRVSGGANIGVGGNPSANGSGAIFSACAIDTNLVVVSWHEYNANTVTPRCAVISTAGATPVAGTVQSLHAVYPNGVSGVGRTQATCVCSPAAGAFVVAYLDPTGTGTVFSRYCTVVGTTITIGPEATVQVLSSGLPGSINNNVFCVAHSPTLVSYATYPGGGGGGARTYITAATISGVILTVGTPVQFPTSSNDVSHMVSLSANSGLCAMRSSYMLAYTIAGTVVTLGAGFLLADTPYSIGLISPTKAFVFTDTSTAYHVTISGATVSAGTPATITGLTSIFDNQTYPGAPALNGGAIISGGDVVDISTATRRGDSGALGGSAQASVTGNGRYALQVISNGSTSVSVRAYLPIVPIN